MSEKINVIYSHIIAASEPEMEVLIMPISASFTMEITLYHSSLTCYTTVIYHETMQIYSAI